MTETYAFVACFILICLTLFQLALILGAPIGRFAWGGAHKVLPLKLRVGSLISIVLYSFFALILLDKAGVTDIVRSSGVVNIGIWIITGYFFIGVLMNAISRSKYERAVMTPTAFILAVLFLGVALS